MSDEDMKRYHAAAHGMQSGVAMEQNYNHKPTEAKHLRTGVNAAMVDHAALANLLMDKGIFTLDEYHKALADAMETEKRRYEAHLSDLTGTKITLA